MLLEGRLEDIVLVAGPLMARPSDPVERLGLLLRKLLFEMCFQLRDVRKRLIAFEAREGGLEEGFQAAECLLSAMRKEKPKRPDTH